MTFDKKAYWKNRQKGKRGQGEDQLTGTQVSGGTVRIGINKFKREHSTSFLGTRNPKHKSIRGQVLRDLKAEGWTTFIDRVTPKADKKKIKKALTK